MRTVKEVSSLTGVSIRTLQFYDKIGLLKPTKVTDAGYRLYDESALETLQQILFFKELDFTLKEIKAIMESPQFNKSAAFEKQRELIQVKRDRLNNLLGLLDKLIGGEMCMDFKDFDMSSYYRILNEFKNTHTAQIITQLGSMEAFDEMVAVLKSHENEIVDMAIEQYGSVENYTSAMKKNLQDFLSNGPPVSQSEVNGLIEKTDALTKQLTADLSKDAASAEIQETVGELVSFTNKCNKGTDMGENYWQSLAENYVSTPAFIEATDKKYGEGASKFISLALKAYFDKQ